MVLRRFEGSTRAGVRAPVLWTILGAGTILLVVLVVSRKGPAPTQKPAGNAPPAVVAAAPPRTPDVPVPVAPTPSTNGAASLTGGPARQNTNVPAVAAANLPQASAFTKQLVEQLSQIGSDGGPITPEKAKAWNDALQKLIKEGPKALPAIRDFLQKNVDLDVSALEGGDQFSQPTLRMAMLDALWQVGGEDALNLSVQTLGTASDPREIAALANYLEQQSPGKYRDLALTAAKESVAMAAAGQLAGRDVGPAFDVLGRYGDSSVIGDLQNALGQWKYYAGIAIDQLPNDAGLPTLLQMAGDPDSNKTSTRLLALEMLAGHATSSQDALNAVLQQAKGGQIPNATWLTIASVLEGHQFGIGHVSGTAQNPNASSNIKEFHLAYGNQNYHSIVPTEGWTEQDVKARISVIDSLLATKPTEMATKALQQAKGSLSTRLPTQ